MTNSQLYNAIFRRKSTRKYDMAPLPADTLVRLKEFASNARPLDESIRYEFAYLGSADVRNLLPIKAPHYICLYSEKKGNYLMNTGFLLQQMDLYFSDNNLASCWLGMAKPAKGVPMLMNGLEFVIMLAFGNTTEIIHRTNTSEFNRKNLSEISSVVGADALLEPARLAPSASNTQAWFFSGDSDVITVSRKKLNLLKAQVYGKMNQIDIGIALFHLGLSVERIGKVASYYFDEDVAPNGYEFMAKVKISKN
ncbi:nitroreductase family protein [Desulfosporosinus sp. OT]|uniref:nitroreductase family protein n=1 Tax=Desulfosporosinus sp. OT TaxID=913865 RepID=UPI000223AB1F|nr:nitroreductase family protein [Desulfosporosinus sp. OT]EGW36951.1 nitroreductase family protein [Desulfosporosinus sp. OT]